ncbi:Fic family protein [Rhodocyclus purpureus]|uniref:Fic family protein n=1 Tax=Rhodocyclus purpureus TaxID=1067 RepID=UPI001911F3C2|nr:Fic family protein [Rhodocyclus purpureus]MBK5913883.1 cell filamentation protein Fic [Rhodocyclus purpureus]
MDELGYEYLRTELGLSVFPVEHPARMRPVSRLLDTQDELQVPKAVAPKSDDPVEHLIFALRYEGTNLQVLAEAMPRISGADLVARLRQSPSGLFIRKACYLWEWFTGAELADLPTVAGPYGELFDPERYVTGAKLRNAKWRINFNGLGSATYCPTVRLSDRIKHGIESDILGRTKAFLESLGAVNADRALSWAYLSETDSSFAIEREVPGQRKAEAFVALLQQAHEKTELTEDYLADLQSATISNPFERAASFRYEQNWLRGGALRGASSVTYVPPSPQLLSRLMPEFMAMANTLPRQTDPIVAAAVASFGFVFLHPFMDGNGRLSRFLFHHALCQSGRLERGLLLPVSVAMKRHEADYLAALQSFSKPARKLWEVSWIDEDRFDFRFKGADSIYRFWDATSCVEFSFRMAEEALGVDLRRETEFLARFDRISKALDDAYDLRSNDRHLLIVSTLQNGGKVSDNRRKQLAARVPEEVFDFVERLAREEAGVFSGRQEEGH